tara:strand:+ start:958 stop:1677 length:720 start_codon:yes stop_codon:yes gene_type:complete
MSFIAVAAAGLTAVSAGVSLYGKYREGSALEDTDWSGMIGDVKDTYQDNISNLRDRADVVFDKIEEGWKTTTQGIGDRATTMWDEATQRNTGFAGSGEQVYDMVTQETNADIEAENAAKSRELSERENQLRFEQEELAYTQDYEAELAELQGGQESSKGWYPGKHIGNLLGSDVRGKENIVLVGKSPSWINIYEFNYKNNPKRYRGVIADEVRYASIKDSDGYYYVDYSKIDVDFEEVK